MSSPSQHDQYMRRCIELARQAIQTGDSPVGSLIVDGDEIVSEGVEAVRARHDATAHAEMEALRVAFARRHSRDLSGCALYSSVEPCIMCAYAIRLARISVVVSGARGGDAGWAVSGHVVLTVETVWDEHDEVSSTHGGTHSRQPPVGI
jgi:tRNA(adenine34) deaminase